MNLRPAHGIRHFLKLSTRGALGQQTFAHLAANRDPALLGSFEPKEIARARNVTAIGILFLQELAKAGEETLGFSFTRQARADYHERPALRRGLEDCVAVPGPTGSQSVSALVP